MIVIRYEGPKGGPGMPEMLTPTSAIMGAGLGKVGMTRQQQQAMMKQSKLRVPQQHCHTQQGHMFKLTGKMLAVHCQSL